MKVLDSDFIIALLRKNPAVRRKLVELGATEEVIATTIFNAQEVLFGALRSKSKRNVGITRRLLHSLHVLDYDLEGMHHAVEIIRFLTEKGKRIGFFDEMVAGVCVAHSATLVTRNIKHFSRVPGLQIEQW